MADDKNPAGGAHGSDGGAGTEEQKKPDPKPKNVSREDHDRAINDMHKFKREAEEANKKLADAEEEKLRANNEWKTLAEQRKVKAEQLEADNKKLTEAFLRTQKYGAVKTAAVELGLRAEAMDDLDLLDIDGVKVETTSLGRFQVHGAKEYVEELKGKKPHWFKKAGPENINSGTGGGAPGTPKKLTANDLINAEKKMKSGQISQEDVKKLYVDFRAQKQQTK